MNPDQHGDFRVLPVHVVNQPNPTRTPVYRGVYNTYTIPAGTPVTGRLNTETILPAGASRYVAYIKALDDDIVISNNESDAANGTGATIPKALTVPWPVHDSEALYAAIPTIAGASSRITVTVYYLVQE